MPYIPLRERVRIWAEQVRLYWRHTATARDFVRLMRVRLALSKIGRPVCPRRVVLAVDIPALGGRVWLRSHTSDIGVLSEQLAANAYRAIDQHPGDVRTILDLGANTGLVARALLARYPHARVVCVEPEPGNVEMLHRNLENFNGRAAVVAKCVGAAEGTTGLKTTTGDWGYRMAGTGEVPVTTVGRIVADHHLDRIDLLKCDIEGAEREVFGDCSGWIGRVCLAVVECHDLAGEDILPPGWRITDRHGWPAYGVETVALTRR